MPRNRNRQDHRRRNSSYDDDRGGMWRGGSGRYNREDRGMDDDFNRSGQEYGSYGSGRNRRSFGDDRPISGYSPRSTWGDEQEPYFGGSRGSGYGSGFSGERSDFRLSGSDYGREMGPSRTRFGGYQSGRQSGGYDYNDRDFTFGGDYPSSERGYQDDRGRDRGWWDKTTDEVASWFGDEEAERRREMDERRGEHRGRGPKGYTRSDDRIKEDINDRLTDHPYLNASDIEVEVNNSEVTLTGNVDSRWAKRTAEDIAEDVSGVKHVENRIRYSNTGWSQTSSEGFDTDTSDTSTSSAEARSAASR